MKINFLPCCGLGKELVSWFLEQDLSLFPAWLDIQGHICSFQEQEFPSWKAALHVQRGILSKSQRSEGSEHCVYVHSVLLKTEACSSMPVPHDKPCSQTVNKRHMWNKYIQEVEISQGQMEMTWVPNRALPRGTAGRHLVTEVSRSRRSMGTVHVCCWVLSRINLTWDRDNWSSSEGQ